MPKVKTNSGAKKRFALTGTGKIKRKHAYKSHILTKKTKKQKRNLTHVAIVDQTNMFGGRANVWTVAKNTWEKGLQYAYRDRKNKKRTFRALWIQRINAAARLEGLSYSQLMGCLKKAGIVINRKALADLAMNQPAAFKAVVDQAKKKAAK